MTGKMMEGVVPFPPDFAALYRERGYWEDRPLRAVFQDWCDDFADRVALCDAVRQVSFAELDAKATNLALNLLDLGIAPGDRVVVQLPNVFEFVYVHFALQKIGAIPVLALPPHRFREMRFFTETAEAVATFTPDQHRDFSFETWSVASRRRSHRSGTGSSWVSPAKARSASST